MLLRSVLNQQHYSLLERAKAQPELLSWVANDYLDLTGYLLYAFMWDKMEASLDSAKHAEDFITV